MALLDLRVDITNELGKPIGKASIALAGAFMRLKSSDELVIDKIQVFINSLIEKGTIEFSDKADQGFFKRCVLDCDTVQVVKSKVLNQLRSMEKHTQPLTRKS